MEHRPDVVRAPGAGGPAEDERRQRRKRHGVGAIGGGLIGLVVGVAIVVIASRPRWSGDWSDAPVFLFGLPALLLIGGVVIGFLLSAGPEAEDVDAPVRERRAVERGTAAVSEDGQLPGSPVEPLVAPPTASGDPSRLPSQRNVNDADAGREPAKTRRSV